MADVKQGTVTEEKKPTILMTNTKQGKMRDGTNIIKPT
jgi:hypothetical protein